MRLLIDMDEILACALDKCVTLYNQEYATNIKKEILTDWDLDGRLPEGTSMAKYFTENDFFRDLEVIEGSQEYLSRLYTEGHEIFIVTASTPCGVLAKNLWLRENFPWIPWENVIVTGRKDLICGDIMLDDGAHNLENSSVPFPVLFSAPHNMNERRFRRVTTWKEFYELVHKLK